MPRQPQPIRTVLLISPEPWTAHAVSKHHYAQTLVQLGISVFFLDPPDDSLSRPQVSPIPECPGLSLVRAPRVAPGMRFLPAPVRRRLESAWLDRLENLTGCRIDTIWLFENSRFFDMCFAGCRLKIYHQVDLNQNFHPEKAAATANICLCTSDLIRKQLVPHAPHIYKVHHGLAQPESQTCLSDEHKKRFAGGGDVHAAYIGNLDMLYLDADLLADVAKNFPAVTFHFVGGYSHNSALWQKAGNLPNIIWWGKVATPLIPTILERTDVLLVTYQAAHWQDQASPHKFMEYLASGKTIVTTYTDEYKNRRHLIEMVENNADFLKAFARVVGNLDEYNSTTRQAVRKAFADEHTYSKQLDRIFALLRDHKLIPA